MNVIRKDATITNTDDGDDFPGTFQVVLSTPAKDRDGDELAPEDWKTPLPEHITFDIDHGMSVEKTVGSGKPYIDDQGRMIVDGSWSSLQKAQDTRTLVKEGHIRTVSVAFMSEKVTKDGKTRSVRELLNGAFVAIPSNREAVVLGVKAGARNSTADAARLQAAHDALVAAGAQCAPMDDTGAAEDATGGKAVEDVETKALDQDDDPGALAQAVDAALDEAQNLIAQVDPATLPEPIQQALGLITAAENAVDKLLDALGVPDPDDDGDDADDSAPAAAEKAAPVADVELIALQNQLTVISAVAALAG